MGIYRPLNLFVHRSSTSLIEQLDNDIKNINQDVIGDVHRTTLVYDIVQFKKHLDCDITKCPVGLAIIESATLAFCKDLVATHNDDFKTYARKLLIAIMTELDMNNYNGILKDYYFQLRDEKECIAKSNLF